MTNEEHMLMITMFAKQMQSTRVLLQMLRSRDLITADDERAFAALVQQDLKSNAALIQDAALSYTEVAISLGVDVGPTTPPSSQHSAL